MTQDSIANVGKATTAENSTSKQTVSKNNSYSAVFNNMFGAFGGDKKEEDEQKRIKRFESVDQIKENKRPLKEYAVGFRYQRKPKEKQLVADH